MDQLPVGIWVARAPTGEFMYANRTFRVIMGQEGRDDVAAGDFAEPYGIYTQEGESYPESRMPFVLALQRRETVMVDDIVVHRHDDRKVHIRAWARPVLVDDEVDHVVVVFVDITPEVEAQRGREESERLMAQAERMQSIGTLAGGIAHDFNNVLGAIRTIASTLSDTETHAERRASLEAIDAATARAHGLTRSLLDFAGRESAEHEPLSLDAVVSGVLDLFVRATEARVTVVRELGGPPPIRGDAARLEQVVMNLVVNALDALPRGGVVTVKTSAANGHVQLDVVDTGPGVPLDLRVRIFEPYFTTRKSHHGGLGLATAYGVVHAHGGSIELMESVTGAHFRVRLPVAEGATTKAPAGGDAPSSDPGSLRVLLVDDDAMVRGAAALALRTLGHVVEEATGGVAAVERFVERPGGYDVVLLDLAMPDQDGRETYLRLKEIDPKVRVLLASGYALETEEAELLDLGVRGFIHKPFSFAELGGALRDAMDDG